MTKLKYVIIIISYFNNFTFITTGIKNILKKFHEMDKHRSIELFFKYTSLLLYNYIIK